MSLWHGRVRVWSQSAFDAEVTAFQAVPDHESAPRTALRGFLASSAPTGIDDRSRLCIPEWFRHSCGMGIVVVLSPTDDGLEITPLE